MSLVKYVNRHGSNCIKWDAQSEMYGEEGLLPLWVADMDFQVPSCVIDALSDYVHTGVFGYYHVPDSYYQAFIDWESKYHSYDVKKEWIRFSPGVVSGFHWIVNFMTNPGDAVLILTPVYYPFHRAIQNNGRKMITSELVCTEGRYTIDFHDFEQKIIDHNVSLFILCSPHNPVGRVWTREELTTLFDICRKHHVFVISDEIHQDIVFEGHQHVPSLGTGDYDDMMIALTAPSKTFNLAGGQNSIIIIPDADLRKKWDSFVSTIRIENGNPFGYIAAEAAYTKGRPWFDEVKKIIYQNYCYMRDTFASELPGIIVSPLEGTYLAWVDMGSYLKATELKDFMQKKCRLAFDYGSWFGGANSATHIRVNLATSSENVETAVQTIIANLR